MRTAYYRGQLELAPARGLEPRSFLVNSQASTPGRLDGNGTRGENRTHIGLRVKQPALPNALLGHIIWSSRQDSNLHDPVTFRPVRNREGYGSMELSTGFEPATFSFED